MPFSINGFGTTIIGRRGDIGQGGYDAVEWIVAANLPIVPLNCLHTFDWTGNNYRSVPIRWSAGLVARTFFSRWVWIVGILAAALLLMGLIGLNDSGPLAVLIIIGLLLAVLTTGLAICLVATGGRDKQIRRVLGRVTVGNCDPANFDEQTLHRFAGKPKVVYGTKTFAQAVPELLEKGSYAEAMWAVRLCVALEDASEGESLTDEILADPEVAAAIEEVRQEPRRWKKVMLSKDERRKPDEEARDQDWDEEEDDRSRRRRRDDEDRPRRRRDDRDEEDDRPRRRARRDDGY